MELKKVTNDHTDFGIECIYNGKKIHTRTQILTSILDEIDADIQAVNHFQFHLLQRCVCVFGNERVGGGLTPPHKVSGYTYT